MNAPRLPLIGTRYTAREAEVCVARSHSGVVSCTVASPALPLATERAILDQYGPAWIAAMEDSGEDGDTAYHSVWFIEDDHGQLQTQRDPAFGERPAVFSDEGDAREALAEMEGRA